MGYFSVEIDFRDILTKLLFYIEILTYEFLIRKEDNDNMS